MLLFKRILKFHKTNGGLLDQRGAKRYPVGANTPISAKITLTAYDGTGHPLPPEKSTPMDWGGQLLNLSNTGANIRLHPAAVAGQGEKCCLKLALDNKLFELDGTIAHFRSGSQYVSCGIAFNFPDKYTRKAYLQVLEPVVIGATMAPMNSRVKQDLPNLIKEQYTDEGKNLLSLWRDPTAKNPRMFELLVHDYYLRGNTEAPGLKVGYRDGTKVGERIVRANAPLSMSKDHQSEVRQLFELIVPNLTRTVPTEVRKFLELFAV